MKKLILTIIMCGTIILSLSGCNSKNSYKEISVKEFREIAVKNGYYFIDDEKEDLDGVSDYIFGFSLDEDGAIKYKIYFYEYNDMNKLDENLNDSLEAIKNWNDEEKTIKEEKGKNYNKTIVTNKYGYGIVIKVNKTLFVAYGEEDELNKLVNDLYIK